MILFLGINIGGWLTGAGAIVVAGVIVTFLRKKGIIGNVKIFSKTMAKVTEQLGEAFLETSDVFAAADKAINDDGKLIESNVKDVIREGKEAVLEWKDVVMIVKPKK